MRTDGRRRGQGADWSATAKGRARFRAEMVGLLVRTAIHGDEEANAIVAEAERRCAAVAGVTAWAAAMKEAVMDVVQEAYTANGKGEQFALLRADTDAAARR